MDKKEINVIRPLLPPLDEFVNCLEEIWESGYLTNYGVFHEKLEAGIKQFLKVPQVSLFTNGTIALMTALKTLQIKGEVITTPYSFVATSHVLEWTEIKPVFVDINPVTCCMDVSKIEKAITPETTAILPVHVYGIPCDTNKIEEIAIRHNLKVIYDAAHAFGVEKDGNSILNAGDLSVLSFHATKTFNSVEGGAIVLTDKSIKKKIDYLKNFGFEDETEIVTTGINGKLDEIRAAFGWLNLNHIEQAISKRKELTIYYREQLKDIEGISFFEDIKGVKHNYSYFPVFVNTNSYGETRDELYTRLKDEGIFCRRYFYPLISNLPMYKHLESACPENLPIANKMAKTVICLSLHDQLTIKDIDRIVEVIKK